MDAIQSVLQKRDRVREASRRAAVESDQELGVPGEARDAHRSFTVLPGTEVRRPASVTSGDL